MKAIEEPFRYRLSDFLGYRIHNLCQVSMSRHTVSRDTDKRESVSGVSSPTEMMTHRADADTASSFCLASVMKRHKEEL